jgi:tetratricopeptide (TPR) repeat protein
MYRRLSTRSRLVGFAIVVPLAVLLPIAVYAEGGKAPAKKTDDTVAAAKATGASPKYRDACIEGNTKYAARDFPAAIESYRKAIELDPKNPLGHYFLGEAQLAAGNMAEAEAAWSSAARVGTDKDATVMARVYFVLADLKERQKKWADARTAWQAYLDFAAKFPDAGAFPSSAQSRQQVIDAMMKQDKAYDVVRKRIEETKDGGVFSDPNKQPPAAG